MMQGENTILQVGAKTDILSNTMHRVEEGHIVKCRTAGWSEAPHAPYLKKGVSWDIYVCRRSNSRLRWISVWSESTNRGVKL